MGSCRVAWGAQRGALCWPEGWDGERVKREGKQAYMQPIRLAGERKRDVVKQTYANLKRKKANPCGSVSLLPDGNGTKSLSGLELK